MNEPLKYFVKELIDKELGYDVSIEKGISIGGGCINNACLVKTNIGECYFLKYNESVSPKMFEAEAIGLNELYKADLLRVPRVLGFSSEKQSNVTPFILMEYLQSAPKKSNFFEEFGRNFAKLHKITKSQYGFFEDNFIGKTPQINQWMDEWVDFFRDKRLGYQVELAKKSNLWNEKLNKLWEKLESRLDELIGNPKEPASLLHGDLWSGNYLVGPTGEPILIDPAVYYGSREADLAMTELFGGFDRTFYDSYKEEYPIEPEYDDRAQIYKLYHLLNHLNLFGKQYESSVLSIMEHFSG